MSNVHAQDAEKCVLKVGWMEWPSYQYLGDDGQPQGFDIEAIKAVASELNCTTKFRFMQWERQRHELANGNIDIILGMSAQNEVGTSADPLAPLSDRFRSDPIGFYWNRAAAKRFDHVQSLNGLTNHPFRLGVFSFNHRSSELVDLIQAKNIKLKIMHIRSIEGLVNNFKRGRLDGIYIHTEEMMYMLERNPIDDLVLNQSLSYTTDVYLAVTTKSSLGPDLLEKINVALEKIKTNGVYDKLITKYAPTLELDIASSK